ncbi:type VI secretion system Vgr family protein [Caballeronia sp. SL2Y3]|uniref:type VI secretion system Vgr family protein n=1 Tax=Caballeronia sp. SL2Y3 TaxID=2878151 RepID=UPI001FCFB20C|nr:type VI secretion system tip protein TssI/VgrG [Caballeronia sp. SL2Y3]
MPYALHDVIDFNPSTSMPQQSDMRFTIELAGGGPFNVVEFDLDEAISSCFELVVHLSSENPAVDFGSILDQPALLTIWRGDTPVRYVHGLVSTFEQGETGFRRSRYKATIEPAYARAAIRSNWRAFQLKNVPEILQTLMTEQRITDYEQRIYGVHQTREFCVQPGETTLAFCDRIAAEEGLIYSFVHTGQGHRLIHNDRLIVHGAIGGAPVSYNPNPGGDAPEPALRTFRYAERVRTSRVTRRDYTFRNPRYAHEHSSTGASLGHQGSGYENFGYPGRYKTDEAGRPFTQTRLLALRGDAQMVRAEGDDARLTPGLAFELTGHPREELNRSWRPVRIRHRGVQRTSQQEESADTIEGTLYRCTADLIPDDVEWKAPLLPKPRIDGPHIATVTGPAGEEIHTDQHGRVKVQFAWDREGKNDEHSSCWIRVAQNWAGATWGHMAIPRIGQEVIVDWLDVDCDQPIIIGRAYNALNLPPYELPRHKTRMTIKSQTHKGDGFNELRFEDEAGQEEIYVHAQKDQNIHVNHDETTFVGHDHHENVEHDQSIGIGHDRTETVGNDEQVSIGRERRHSVGQDAFLIIERNHTIAVAKDRVETVGNHRKEQTTANHIVDVGGHVEQSVQGRYRLITGQRIERQTQKYLLQAADRAVIQGPGGTITLDNSGVTIEGMAIRFKGPVSIGDGGVGHAKAVDGNPAEGLPNGPYQEFFVLQDAITGKVLRNHPYRLQRWGKGEVESRSDAQGRTQVVNTENSELLSAEAHPDPAQQLMLNSSYWDQHADFKIDFLRNPAPDQH